MPERSALSELRVGGCEHGDVGSGPGTVGVQLARLFDHVTLLEPDPDMLITTFLNSQLRSGNRLVADYSVERFEQTLQRTSFGTPCIVLAPGRRNIVRDADGVIAGCLSMSYAAPHLFGPRLDEFITALRQLLEGHSPTGRFWDWPGDTEILIATRR